MFTSEALQVSKEDREAVIEILKNGRTIAEYLGFARCRICNAMLGTKDLAGYGFVWPQRAEHYIVMHDVWISELSELLEAATAQNRLLRRDSSR